MTHLRIRALTVTTVVLICIPSIECFGHWPQETLSLGIDEKKEDIEYEENPRIQMRHEGRIIEYTLTENGRYENIDVIVYASKETIILNLKLNRQLFASSYVEKIITESEVIYNGADHVNNNCYYLGTVQNKSDSRAAVSTCEGINGYFTIGNLSYHIEAEARENRLNGAKGVHNMRHSLKPIYDYQNDRINFTARFHFASKHRRQRRSFEWPQDIDGGTKLLEVYIINDRSQFAGNKNDTAAVFQRAKSVANSASSLYQSVGIYFVLVGMEVWTAADRFFVNGSNGDATLEALNRYRLENVTNVCYNDHAILLTKAGFDNRAAGYANFAKICSNQNSSSIVVDNYSSAAATALVMARQIGRSFGLSDDRVSCYCPDSVCIMSTVQSENPATDWSWCSLQQFNYSFRTGLDICLYDSPRTIYEPTSSTCGNGIIETGEQCDCGRSKQSDCNSSCCDPISCQLTRSAACASGRCCDKSRCQILAAGSLCRNSSSDCDLPEHCDGVVSKCPVDTYKPNGTPCSINGDSVFCYNGKCNSHRSQCELIWGKGTNSSDPICYLNFNTYGVHYGNCGFKWLPSVTYIPCEKKDGMCGRLLCDNPLDRSLAFYQIYFTKSTSSIHNLTCTSVIFDFGLRIQDPGLVPNGASCGDGKMCINQICVDVSSVQTPCLESCRGDQVCNNLGRCQSQSVQDPSTLKTTMTSVSEKSKWTSTMGDQNPQVSTGLPGSSSQSIYGQSSATILWSIVAFISHLLLTI